MRYRSAPRLPAWAPLGAICLLIGCGTPEPHISVADLPPYTAEEAHLYDDSIASEVVDGQAPGSEPSPPFVERVIHADLIVPVKLVAINVERSADAVRYQLVADPSGEPLHGFIGEGPLELAVGRASPSLALLKAMDTQLVGRDLIVIARRYQREGEIVVHFRAEPDTLEVREAVREALASQVAKADAETAP